MIKTFPRLLFYFLSSWKGHSFWYGDFSGFLEEEVGDFPDDFLVERFTSY